VNNLLTIKQKIIMKKFMLILFAFFSIGVMGQVVNYGNTAVEYCKLLGYDIDYDKSTGKILCVLPNGDKVSPWQFYRGKVGHEFSYCSKKGYKLRMKEITRNGATYAIPICNIEGKQSKSMIELLKEDKDYSRLFKDLPEGTVIVDTIMDAGVTRAVLCLDTQTGYDMNFTWNNVNGDDFDNSPENQGSYGICYAMASASVAESVLAIYNETPIGQGFTNLSQAFIAFFGQFVDFSIPYLWYGIRGSDGLLVSCMEEATERLCLNGIVEEVDFPWDPDFTESSDTIFSEMFCDRYRLTNWSTVGTTRSDIKDALENGPVWATMTYTYTTHTTYSGGILKNPGNGPNHAVAIVGWGYDEMEECEYWIVKNSYGNEWGNELYPGYMWIATTNALDIQENVYSVTYDSVEIDGIDLAYEDQVISNVPEEYSDIHYRPVPYTLFNGYTSSSQWTSGSTTSLSPKSTVSGEATLIFRTEFENNPYNATIDLDTLVYHEKLIWAGKPVAPSVSGSTSIDCYSPVWYYATALSSNGLYTAESFSWSVSSGLQILNTYGTPPRIRVQATSAGNHTITCNATNDIGANTSYYSVNCPVCYCLGMSVFPNPVSDQLTVNIEDSGNIEPEFQIDLIDSSNRKWKSKSTKSKTTVFSVNDVPRGTYLLRVVAKHEGKKIKEETKTVLIIK